MAVSDDVVVFRANEAAVAGAVEQPMTRTRRYRLVLRRQWSHCKGAPAVVLEGGGDEYCMGAGGAGNALLVYAIDVY